MNYIKRLIVAKKVKSWERTEEQSDILFWFKVMVEMGFIVSIYLFSWITYLIVEVF